MITAFKWLLGHSEEFLLVGTIFMVVCLIVIAWMSTHVPNDNRGSVTLVLLEGTHRNSLDSNQLRRSENPNESILSQLPNVFDSDAQLQHRRTGSNVSDTGSISNYGDDSPDNTPVMLRLKYLDDRMKTVYASLQESIRSFKTKNFANELSENLTVRLIYNGRELKEGKRLSAYGLAEGCTIHCLVTSRRLGSGNVHDGDREGHDASDEVNGLSHGNGERDISRLVFPVFGILVGLIWYCRIAYKQYFNVISTFALLGITVLFLAASFTLWSSTNAIPTVTGNQTTSRDIQNGNSGSTATVRVVRYRSD